MKKTWLLAGAVLALCVSRGMATSDFDRMVKVNKSPASISITDISEDGGGPVKYFNYNYNGGLLNIYLKFSAQDRPVGTHDTVLMMVTTTNPYCQRALKFHHLTVAYAVDPVELDINMDQCFTPGASGGSRTSGGNSGVQGSSGVGTTGHGGVI